MQIDLPNLFTLHILHPLRRVFIKYLESVPNKTKAQVVDIIFQ